MNARKVRINDPFFNEFIYHCIVSSPAEWRNKLPTELLKHTHTKEKIKRFSDRASLEQKIEMLSRLGVGFAGFFSVPEHLSTQELKEAYKNYKEQNNYDTVNSMIRKRQFVFVSRDVMAILGIMGQNCHSNTYMLNREYSTLASEINNLSKLTGKKIRDIDIVKDILESNKMVVKLVLQNLMNQTFVDAMTGYKTIDLMLLLFLYLRMDKNTTTYTPLSKIQEYFKGIYTDRNVSVALLGLYKNLHVDRFPRKMDYAVSGIGVQVVASYLSRLITNMLNR